MSSIGTFNLHSHTIHAAQAGIETPGDDQGSGRLWLASVILLLLAAGVYFGGAKLFPGSVETDDLAFSASDSNGHMRVTWNRNSPLIETAENARLDVLDGANSATYPVDASVLKSGALEYLRHSSDVLLTLTMMRDGKPLHREMIRSIGADSPAEAPARGSRARTR